MVKIRLSRHGAKKRPYYRVVVADSRMPRDGRFIEQVGRYNPCVHPHLVEFDLEKVDKWLASGAQPTDTVDRLLAAYREGKPVGESKGAKKSSKKADKAEA